MTVTHEYTQDFGIWRCNTSAVSFQYAFDEVTPWGGEDSDDDGESDDDDTDEWQCNGLRQCSPGLYEWLIVRIGTPGELLVILVFLILDASSFVIDEMTWDSKVNVTSMAVMTNLASLFVSVSTTFTLEGSWAVNRVMNCHVLWRFGVIALLFQMAVYFNADAYRAGTPAVVVKTLGYIYLPVSAVASKLIFRRDYGRLEWMALLMMMLAMAALGLLRERCRAGDCDKPTYVWPGPLGTGFVIGSVLLSCMASILAERIYTDRSFGLRHLLGTNHDHYYIHKVHLDLCALIISLAAWVCPISFQKSIWGIPSGTSWWGTWTKRNFLYVPVTLGKCWLAGLITKRYSTVTKALIQTVATALVICLEDPVFARARFEQVMVPSLCMLVIIMLSALIFQTGRININLVTKMLATAKEEHVHKLSDGLVEAFHMLQQVHSARSSGITELVCKYLVIIMYTLADATRTILYTVSVGQSMITPQSFAVAMNGAMLCLSNALLFQQPPDGVGGAEALREAWACRKLLKFMPCGLLFATTSALMSTAMGLGISGSMSVVVGKIYLPICAVVSRFLLGRYYMWLEWFAIIILTVDSAAFGFLKDMGVGSGRQTSKLAVLCCALSAASSAMSAMVMEKLMKSEPGKPFMMQKLRTDFACLVWSLAFLPVMGWLADPTHFAKGAFWRYRPLTLACSRSGVCGSWNQGGAFEAWDGGGSFAHWGPNDTLVANGTLACACGKGIFVCWDDIKLYLMLTVSVFYGFITGLVVTRFGGVMRAIADNFSLLLVYVVGDPLVNHTTLDDTSLNLTAVILPLSSETFSLAAQELQKAQSAREGFHALEGDGSGEGDEESRSTSDESGGAD